MAIASTSRTRPSTARWMSWAVVFEWRSRQPFRVYPVSIRVVDREKLLQVCQLGQVGLDPATQVANRTPDLLYGSLSDVAPIRSRQRCVLRRAL